MKCADIKDREMTVGLNNICRLGLTFIGPVIEKQNCELGRIKDRAKA